MVKEVLFLKCRVEVKNPKEWSVAGRKGKDLSGGSRKLKVNIRKAQSNSLKGFGQVSQFRLWRTKVLLSDRNIEKQISHGNGRSHGTVPGGDQGIFPWDPFQSRANRV
jgi:hypothetical protein